MPCHISESVFELRVYLSDTAFGVQYDRYRFITEEYTLILLTLALEGIDISVLSEHIEGADEYHKAPVELSVIHAPLQHLDVKNIVIVSDPERQIFV